MADKLYYYSANNNKIAKRNFILYEINELQRKQETGDRRQKTEDGGQKTALVD